MLPSEAPVADWRLYYDNTYMLCDGQPHYIKCINDESGEICLIKQKIQSNGALGSNSACIIKDMDILWPRPTAVGVPSEKTAFFIGRSSYRHMKRSASAETYYVRWKPGTKGLRHHPLNYASLPPNFISLKVGLTNLSLGYIAVALSFDIILHKDNEDTSNVALIYRGLPIGRLNTSTNELTTYMPHDSRMYRIDPHLKEVGIKCHY